MGKARCGAFMAPPATGRVPESREGGKETNLDPRVSCFCGENSHTDLSLDAREPFCVSDGLPPQEEADCPHSPWGSFLVALWGVGGGGRHIPPGPSKYLSLESFNLFPHLPC